MAEKIKTSTDTKLSINFSADENALDPVSIFFVDDKQKIYGKLSQLNKKNIISSALENQKNFKGELYNTCVINAQALTGCELIIVMNLGKEKRLTTIEIQKIGATLTRKLNALGSKAATIYLDQEIFATKTSSTLDEIALSIAFGSQMENYKFLSYYHKKLEFHKDSLKTININLGSQFQENIPQISSNFTNTINPILNGIMMARDLVNGPPNDVYPASFAEKCLELQELGVKVTIMEEDALKNLGMRALLGVAQGSAHKPKVVVMEWTGDATNNEKYPIAFAGKGVTFDTGGVNLKPTHGIAEMKYDMGGAAVVTGLIASLAGRKAKVNAVGIIGLVENMISGTAQRPSDVVVSMSNQTIEIDNTDAEGRLVLCDIMWYIQEKYRPETLIDLATLTGAVVVALGEKYAGLFSNDEKLVTSLCKSGEETNELLWRLPLDPFYDEQINSDIADIKNTGQGRGAGSTTAAQFLQRFVQNNVKWAHLDIAGVSWTKKPKQMYPKGATGFGVKLLDDFIQQNYEKKSNKN